MTIKNHRLEDAQHRKSPNVGRKMTPLVVVIHYTAGTRAIPAINTFMNPASRVSAHLVIDRAGRITQLVDFNRVAWHAGVSELPGYKPGCNRYSIGIELVNRGWRKDKPEIGEEAEWLLIEDQYWQIYPELQLAALDGAITAIWEEYSPKILTGHEFIAPTRKQDPGPVFPWDRYEGYEKYLDKAEK